MWDNPHNLQCLQHALMRLQSLISCPELWVPGTKADLRREEIDGDELVSNIWPLLCHALGRPDVTLADLCHAPVQRQAGHCGRHHGR